MEPQADYYATKECVPSFLRRNSSWLKNKYVIFNKIHSAVKARCENRYIDDLSVQICKHSSQGALELSKIHIKFDHPKPKDPVKVSPETPDINFVTELNRNSYPSNQCRFDSYFYGALNLKRPKCWCPDLITE